MNELRGEIKYLVNKHKSFEEICDKLNLKDYELVGLVKMMKEEGELLDIIGGNIVKLKKPSPQEDIYEVKHNLERLKLLLISDTHLCSKFDRLDILRYLYDKAEDNGVKHILHSGDFTDGKSNRPEHVYELRECSYEGQIDYCVDKYPTYSGKTYVISGNHDDWWYKSNGSEILKPISARRDDIVYLGPDVADMRIGKLKIRLFHGKGGIAYAKSYKLQKYLENIPSEERPHILQMGHIHQAFYYNQDKTHCFQTSCLEDQTPYCRGLGLSNDKSVWWVDIMFDDNGKIQSVTPKLETFDKKLVRIRKK